MLLAAGGARAQEARSAPDQPHQIPAITSPISIDGVLDEPAWGQAWSATLPWEVWPGENIAAPVRTEVLLAHDDSALYVGFRAHDPEPALIRAHLSDRDSISDDDWVGIVLDTFNDGRRGFQFRVNPHGVQEDRVESTLGGGAAWDAIWDSAAAITSWGYSAEMKIPFSSLRFQRLQTPQIWGFDAERSYPRQVVHSIGLIPRERDDNCPLCRAEKIQGFAGAAPGHDFMLVPTVTGLRTDRRHDLPDGELAQGDIETEAGVTGYWHMTPNMTMTGTFNPDFSQIEADARQLDINAPFALFYPEKRPFFMEGADFFSTPFDIIYTRTLRDPAWGIKLTGKEGNHTVGAYLVRDDVTNLILPGSQSSSQISLAQESTALAVRYKLDLGDQVTLGAIYSGREGQDDYYNRLLAVDGDIRITDSDRLWFNLARSTTRYSQEVLTQLGQPEQDLEDTSLLLFYIRNTRHVGVWAHYRDVGEDFRADLGYMPKVGYQQAVLGAEYQWIPGQDSWYTHLEVEGEHLEVVDEHGDLLERYYLAGFTYKGPLQSHVYLRAKSIAEVYQGHEYDLTEILLDSDLHPSGSCRLSLDMVAGDHIDYVNSRLGSRIRLQPVVSLNLGTHFKVHAEHTFERMKVSSQHLFTANISQATLAYQFNTRAFVRGIIQYVDLDYNVEMYTDDRPSRDQELFTQLLFSYKLNPQTVLFLGYSDTAVGRQYLPAPASATRTSSQGFQLLPQTTDELSSYGLTLVERTIFAKVGYSWSF
jgi:hypothetical protein